MCYSGRCRWEGYMGDCGFPTLKEVREKYQYPVCEIDVQSKGEQEYVNDAYDDIKKIIKNVSHGNTNSDQRIGES